MSRNTERATRSDGERSRQTILQAAARLATIEGLDGLSIGRLAEHVGMSKSGLYAHFTSKEDLQLATIETAVEIFDTQVVQPTGGIEDPVVRIVALCDRFMDYLADRVFPGGCFLAAAAAEFDTHPGPVKDRIVRAHREWMDMLEDLFADAKRMGLVDERESPAQLSFEVDAHLAMANLMFVLHDDLGALERGRQAIRSRIDLARSAPIAPA